MSNQSISIVVPVYNSQNSLPLLVERLRPVLDSLGGPYELVLVNDGSRDDSWNVVTTLATSHPWVRGINMMKNFGQHNALLCGIRSAKNEVIVTIDDDLQNPPEEIPTLLNKLNEGFDVVYGPPMHEQHGLLRDLASQITKLVLQKAMGAKIARKISAFRVFRTHLRGAFAGYTHPFVSIDVLLSWGTSKFAAVPVQHDPRTIGVSNYTVRKLVLHALNMITGFSTLPLQLASWMGFALTFVGIGLLAYVIIIVIVHGSPVAGFPFLASAITLFSGAQLFALGIIGEYLARMHQSMMERPAYVVLKTTEDSTKTPAA